MPKKNLKNTTSKKDKNSFLVEKKYISLTDTKAESLISTKKIILWTTTTLLSLIIITGWLISLLVQINKQNKELETVSLFNQISETIKNFDQQLKNNSLTINSDNIQEIKNNVIEELKQSSINNSIWPTKQLNQLNLSIQLPESWQINLNNNQIKLISTSSSSTIEISLNKNSNNLPLTTWLEKTNPQINKDYSLKEPIFKFKETTTDLYLTNNSAATTTLDFIYLINSTSTKSIYLIKVFAENPTEDDKKIIEEIIKGIKILNK